MELKNECVILNIETYNILKDKINSLENKCVKLEKEYDRVFNEINKIKNKLISDFIEKNKIPIEVYLNIYKGKPITENVLINLNDYSLKDKNDYSLKDKINELINKYNIGIDRIAFEIDCIINANNKPSEMQTIDDVIDNDELPFADI